MSCEEEEGKLIYHGPSPLPFPSLPEEFDISRALKRTMASGEGEGREGRERRGNALWRYKCCGDAKGMAPPPPPLRSLVASFAVAAWAAQSERGREGKSLLDEGGRENDASSGAARAPRNHRTRLFIAHCLTDRPTDRPTDHPRERRELRLNWLSPVAELMSSPRLT